MRGEIWPVFIGADNVEDLIFMQDGLPIILLLSMLNDFHRETAGLSASREWPVRRPDLINTP